MNDYLVLGQTETVAGRTFAEPEQNTADVAALRHMLARLRHLLSQPEGVPDSPRPLILNLSESGGRGHRIVLANPERLRTASALALVGFFGCKRPGTDPAPLTAVDDELIDEFPQHPGILSYSSLEGMDGNWSNLVVLDSPEASEHWKTSAKHMVAVRELAPGYYTTIRLHNGRLPDSLLSGVDLILLRTKYYDFQGDRPWRAVREFSAPESKL